MIRQESNPDKDFLDELTRQQLERLHESIAQYERGEIIPHEKIILAAEKWLKGNKSAFKDLASGEK